MLDTVLSVLRKYDSDTKKEDDDFKTRKLATNKLYGGSLKGTQDINELEKEHSENVLNMRKEVKAAVIKEFDDIKQKVTDYATKAPSNDFNNTLAALQVTGGMITDEAADAYFNKYKDNFIARNALISLYHKANIAKYAKYQVIGFETVLHTLDQAYDEIMRAVDQLGSYKWMLLIKNADDNILMRYNTMINDFLNGTKSDFYGWGTKAN